MIKASKKISDQKMRDLADQLKVELPGCGFALITFDVVNNETCANYVSNLTDDFMIKALEMQLDTLRKGKETTATGLLNSGS